MIMLKESDEYLSSFHHILRIQMLRPLVITKMISQDPISAYRYAHFILDAPWPLGEKAIATKWNTSYYYATDVIKGRWLPGEDAIFTNRDFMKKYGAFLTECERISW